MIRVLRDFRLLPLVLLATVSLLALKLSGLVFDGGYILGPTAAHEGAKPAASDDGNFVGLIALAGEPAPIPDLSDVTGSVGGDGKKEADKKEVDKKEADKKKEVAQQKDPAAPAVRSAARSGLDTPVNVLDQRIMSPSERAILERLQERRKDLEVQARKLDMREALLKAAEKRMESQAKELKLLQDRINAANGNGDEATAARFKKLIAMYENMKAKEAARIFDRLDLKILVDVAGKINPRQMSEILANMSPEAAERLTVEFASRGGALKGPAPADLPKIEGRPNPG